MLIYSHKRMSEFIYFNIKENTSFTLNKLMFKLGNMSPDMPLYHRHLKHYKYQNFDAILQMIDELSMINPSESISKLNLYSYRLGVITHYISDYFCLPHNDRETYSDKLKEHLLYEKNMHKDVLNYSNENTIYEDLADFSDFDIKSVIDSFMDMYIADEQSSKNDIRYAISASSMIASILLIHSLSTTSQPFVYA